MTQDLKLHRQLYRFLGSIVIISFLIVVNNIHLFFNLHSTWYLWIFVTSYETISEASFAPHEFGLHLDQMCTVTFNYKFASYSSRDIYHICVKVQSYWYITGMILIFVYGCVRCRLTKDRITEHFRRSPPPSTACVSQLRTTPQYLNMRMHQDCGQDNQWSWERV